MTNEAPKYIHAPRVGDAYKEYVSRQPRKKFKTGFAFLDRSTNGGLRAGDVTVVGAATGMGKTSFAEQLALSMARETHVLLMPLEVGEEDTYLRFGARVERRAMSVVTAHANADAVQLLNGRDLTVTSGDRNTMSVEDVVQNISLFSPDGVVIIDHARHIEGWLPFGKQSVHISATQIMQVLQNAAVQLRVHIVLCAQLNRTGQMSDRPQLSHLQDTSALEQLASQVILLHRPFQKQGKDKDVILEMYVAKNRTGPLGLAHYHWNGPLLTLSPMTPEEESYVTCCDRSGA